MTRIVLRRTRSSTSALDANGQPTVWNARVVCPSFAGLRTDSIGPALKELRKFATRFPTSWSNTIRLKSEYRSAIGGR